MKKYLTTALLVILVTACSMLPCLSACNGAEDDKSGLGSENSNGTGADANVVKEYDFGVIADSQVMPADAFLGENPWNTEYAAVWEHYPVEHANEYTEAIFASAVDEYIKSGVKFILLIGDITNDGDPRAIESVKQGLAKLKAAGIDVYTTLGLCDRYGIPYEYSSKSYQSLTCWDADANFKSDFYQFMGATPFLEDANSLSYAVNIPDSDLMLISLDTTANLSIVTPEKYNVHCILQNIDKYKYVQTGTDSLLTWLEDALLTARMQSRTPIITTYMPLDESIGELFGQSTRNTCLIFDEYKKAQKLCAEYGVKAVFSGQLHMPGDSTYTDANGNTFQELATGSLCTYPLPITTYDVMSNKTFQRNIGRMQTISEAYLPNYTSDDNKTALTTDAVEFAKQAMIDGFIALCKGKVSGLDGSLTDETSYVVKLMKMLGIYDGSNPKKKLVMDTIANWLSGMNDVPIYGAEDSVESICASYGITLPKTNYTTTLDFMCKMTCSMYDGTFDLSPESDNMIIFKYCFYSGFYYMANPNVITMLHNAEPDIIDCDLDPVIEAVYKQDMIDLKINDLARTFLSVIAIRINKDTPLKITVGDTQSILSGLKSILPIALGFLPDVYDGENAMVWGIPINEIANLEKGEVYGANFFTVVGAQFFSSTCVKYR